MKRTAIFVVALLLALGMVAQCPGQAADKDLVSDLRDGGYIIFIRHPKTNADQADTDPLNPDNIKAQRQLTDEGRKQAKALGKAFRALKVPVDKVISSQFHRAAEASKLLDVGEVTTTADVSEGGLVVSPNENNRRTKALRTLLGTPPPAGKNLVIMSHKPNLVDAAGRDFVDLAEGETAIFIPLGDGNFKFVARVTGEKWTELAK